MVAKKQKKTTDVHAQAFYAFVYDNDSYESLSAMDLSSLDLKAKIFKGGIEAAYTYLKENRSPSILLVDISGLSLPISEVSSLAEVCEPGVEVIVVGDNNDVSIFRSLVNLGVRDYMVKPLTEKLIIKTLENIGHKTKDHSSRTSGFTRIGNLISFVGTRGGVGTSFITSAVATILTTKLSKRACIFESDLRRGIQALLFDQRPVSGIAEIFSDVDRVEKNILDKLIINVNERLSLVSAQEGLSEKLAIDPEAVNQFLHILSTQFHYTLVDIERSFYEASIRHILAESSIITLILDGTIMSVREAISILNVLKEVKKFDQEIIPVLNHPSATGTGVILPEQIQETLGLPIEHIFSFDEGGVMEAMNTGVPYGNVSNRLTNELNKFVDRLIGKKAPTKQGFFEKAVNLLLTK